MWEQVGRGAVVVVPVLVHAWRVEAPHELARSQIDREGVFADLDAVRAARPRAEEHEVVLDVHRWRAPHARGAEPGAGARGEETRPAIGGAIGVTLGIELPDRLQRPCRAEVAELARHDPGAADIAVVVDVEPDDDLRAVRAGITAGDDSTSTCTPSGPPWQRTASIGPWVEAQPGELAAIGGAST